jgi:hypothetical protein
MKNKVNALEKYARNNVNQPMKKKLNVRQNAKNNLKHMKVNAKKVSKKIRNIKVNKVLEKI